MRPVGYRRRPVVGLAIAMLAGAALGPSLALSWRSSVAVLGLAVGCCLAGGVCLRVWRSRGQPIRYSCFAAWLIAAALFCGMMVHAASARKAAPDWIPPSLAGRFALTGMIERPPEPMGRGTLRSRWIVQMRLKEGAVLHNTDRVELPAGSRVRMIWAVPGKMAPPAYGEVWRIEADTRKLLLPENSFAGTVWPQERRRCAVSGNPFLRFCYRARTVAYDRLGHGIEDLESVADVNRALLLGYRRLLPRETGSLGAATGTMHLFAISGLHVGIVAGFVIFLLRAFRVPLWRWVYFLAPFLCAYVVLTGARPSAVRAGVMTIAYFCAYSLRRRPDAPTALGLAAIGAIVSDPLVIGDVGFIYSFVVVTGLLILCPALQSLGRRLDHDDIPLRVQGWSYYRQCFRTYTWGLVVVSVAAWLSSAPLTAYYFGRFTPIARLANLLVIPFAFMLVLCGCLSLALGGLSLLFADIFNHAAVGVFGIMSTALTGLAAIPGGSFDIQRPSLGMIIACYLVLFAGGWRLARRIEAVPTAPKMIDSFTA